MKESKGKSGLAQQEVFDTMYFTKNCETLAYERTTRRHDFQIYLLHVTVKIWNHLLCGGAGESLWGSCDCWCSGRGQTANGRDYAQGKTPGKLPLATPLWLQCGQRLRRARFFTLVLAYAFSSQPRCFSKGTFLAVQLLGGAAVRGTQETTDTTAQLCKVVTLSEGWVLLSDYILPASGEPGASYAEGLSNRGGRLVFILLPPVTLQQASVTCIQLAALSYT